MYETFGLNLGTLCSCGYGTCGVLKILLFFSSCSFHYLESWHKGFITLYIIEKMILYFSWTKIHWIRWVCLPVKNVDSCIFCFTCYIILSSATIKDLPYGECRLFDISSLFYNSYSENVWGFLLKNRNYIVLNKNTLC